MSDYYSVHVEGSREAWSHTPGATGDDFDAAAAEAEKRSRERDRNYVVKYNSHEGSRTICTAVPGEGIVWPRLASPPAPVLPTAHQLDEQNWPEPGEVCKDPEHGQLSPDAYTSMDFDRELMVKDGMPPDAAAQLAVDHARERASADLPEPDFGYEVGQ